jgi:uncharacterized protein YndB with AHSA1/START domain
MSPRPTGRLVPTDDGTDLVLERTFRAGIDDVWASITEPERTARWFASWTGDAVLGGTIRYRMVFEEGDAEAEMVIEACEPPHHLAVRSTEEHGSWYLEARLHQSGDQTTLTFVHHLDDSADPQFVGPGWEYYLDMLVASRDDRPPLSFDDYFPAQQAYYQGLANG